jgi:hypothetical protein
MATITVSEKKDLAKNMVLDEYRKIALSTGTSFTSRRIL